MDRPVVTNPALLSAAVEGLDRPRKRMEPKWFYDSIGSALFEDITRLPEYYPTRTEVAILRDNVDRLADEVPDGAELVELGSGASAKTRILLDNMPGLGAYVPVDVSADFLAETADSLRQDYPELPVQPVAGDFTQALPLPDSAAPRVAFFPGSTLGNLDEAAAQALLRRVRAWPGIRAFVLGIDLVKDADTLVRAYDDAAGVTARFNLNLLRRMNDEIGTDFDLGRFAHRAVWNAGASRIEMHLESLGAQEVQVGGRAVPFADGETIHTENSRKFTPEGLARLAAGAGWRLAEVLTDRDRLFAVAILHPA